ncbi:MAG: hemerythrin domain-containing protein [Candidatus Xenobia bacterium]
MSTRCDALSVLKRDHRHLKSLFHQIDLAARHEDVAAMRDLATQIVTELNRHVNLEEHLFYPAVSEWLPDARHEVLENIEEHRALRFLLDALQAASPSDEQFQPRLPCCGRSSATTWMKRRTTGFRRCGAR